MFTSGYFTGSYFTRSYFPSNESTTPTAPVILGPPLLWGMRIENWDPSQIARRLFKKVIQADTSTPPLLRPRRFVWFQREPEWQKIGAWAYPRPNVIIPISVGNLVGGTTFTFATSGTLTALGSIVNSLWTIEALINCGEAGQVFIQGIMNYFDEDGKLQGFPITGSGIVDYSRDMTLEITADWNTTAGSISLQSCVISLHEAP